MALAVVGIELEQVPQHDLAVVRVMANAVQSCPWQR